MQKSEVQRYSTKIDFDIHPDAVGMQEDENGEYVSYEDYQSLLAEKHSPRGNIRKIILSGGTKNKDGHIEQNNDNPDFFSVYFRHYYGALECTGSFSERRHALEYATLMAEKHQVPLYNETFRRRSEGQK